MKFSTVIGACVLVTAPSFCFTAVAQNTSGVAGPVIDAGESAWEYRSSYDTENEELNQRLHYQRAINGDLRWRFVTQLRETADSDFDTDFVRGELVWQMTPDGQKYQSGLRFDGRYRFDDRPGDVAIQWIHQWSHFDNWTLRFNAIASRQFGNGQADGLFIQTRASAHASLTRGPRIGFEIYNQYGTTSDWLGFDEQDHQAGPFAVWALNPDWNLFTGVLVGLTEASPDGKIRMRVTRNF